MTFVIGLPGKSAPTGLGLAFFVPGMPTASQLLGRFDVTIPGKFPPNYPSSVCSVTAAPTSTPWSAVINVNGAAKGQILFTVGSTVGSFSSASDTVVAAGDLIEIYADGTVNPTLQDFTLTLQGYSL